MPTAYIYRGSFEVRAGETLRYVEVAADGTISPEVTRTYAELAGSGSIAAASVSLTPTVVAPTLTGVQIGAIEGVSVSLQPTVSPAAVSGVQVGSVAAAAVSLTPSVTAPSVAGVSVGIIIAAAVSCRPTVAVGTLTGAAAPAGATETFSNAFTSWPYMGDVGTWTTTGAATADQPTVNGGNLVLPIYVEPEFGDILTDRCDIVITKPAGTLNIKCRLSSGSTPTEVHLYLNGAPTTFQTISSTTAVTLTFTHGGGTSFGVLGVGGSVGTSIIIEDITWA